MALFPLATSLTAHGQGSGWPARQVRLVLPSAAGGAQDGIAREVAERLSVLWGQPVVVDNKAGAGGMIGTDLVAKAAPDGYTVLFATEGPIVGAAFTQERVPYDPVKDFTPIGLIASFPLVLVAHPSLNVKTVAQLIALAKARPGAIDYASNGTGGSLHTSMEVFTKAAGIQLNHVAYKGGAPAVQDVLAGHVPLTLSSVATALPYLQDGRLTALGIGSARRFPGLPNVPTIAESGLPQYEASTWGGLMLPRGTPQAIVSRMQADLTRITENPQFRDKLLQVGAQASEIAPSDFAAKIAADYRKTGCALKNLC